MSSADIDEILRRLSTRFNKIFYDREFVCCVHEDLQVILENKNKCCVVVFPLLGPNYLKAVRYQAKIFDLAVFTLGSDKASYIAVCHKEYLIKKSTESEDPIMPEHEQECGANKLKKKRPERQLYVPPAQRRLSVNELPIQHSSKVEDDNAVKAKRPTCTSKKKLTPKLSKRKCDSENNENTTSDYSEIPGSVCQKDILEVIARTNCNVLWWKYELFDNTCGSNFRHVPFRHFLDEFILFSCHQALKISILKKDHFLWQPQLNVTASKNTGAKFQIIFNYDLSGTECNSTSKTIMPLLELDISKKTYEDVMTNYSVFCDYDVMWVKDKFSNKNYTLNLFDGVYYLENNDSVQCESFEDQLKHYGLIMEETDNIKTNDNSDFINGTSVSSLNLDTKVEDEIPNCLEIVNSANKETPSNENDSELHQRNIKNSTNLNKSIDYLKTTINVNANVKSKNNHEEEKEIMRKAKENINRKTRPIIKYIDDTNNTLKIDRNDNVNNWEDLFDDDGQLEENLLKEIVHKVGTEVTIVKAKEDYSEYVCKQIEELEHMVELYDFPSTLETHDLIQAFSEIKSDAMYIKWVDDTHAILVLGSLSQAQKAVNLGNPFIKVRPMTAASRISLETAYQSDLKPAMKRPQTNLQTARRLITSHLGQKSSVSKEKSARERDDLKAAREMKRLVRKNEQDAWEGNLRSSIK